MSTLTELWPLFGLKLTTPRLELSPVSDADLPHLIAAVHAGIHDPAVMPFSYPWTDAKGEELTGETLKYFWQTRAGVSPDRWIINFGVWIDGDFAGVQELMTTDFPVLKTVRSGSWLTMSRQGQGIGTEMRQAVLAYAFDYLGAEVAESDAAPFNHASLGVSRKLGYRYNGATRVAVRDGELREQRRVRLDHGDFIRPTWTLSVQGHDDVARLLGL
ncbi:GNAT family N-acetyltransferase [Arthrobacter sp. H14]|uniref:GNAT family N-acetyltransferase n=1 Tax=Arthrobacter sp. H14 TaxID=1312959 RepID=UPI00047BCF42|nr:GNAT family N-acetyltransferase [Arthrobacter sp. H14]